MDQVFQSKAEGLCQAPTINLSKCGFPDSKTPWLGMPDSVLHPSSSCFQGTVYWPSALAGYFSLNWSTHPHMCLAHRAAGISKIKWVPCCHTLANISLHMLHVPGDDQIPQMPVPTRSVFWEAIVSSPTLLNMFVQPFIL